MHIYSLEEAQLDRQSIVTIGVFDGVHRGHQYLLHELVVEARDTDRASVVLTFFPHPDVVLKGLEGRFYLTTPEKRAELILNFGVDVVITHPFNEDIRHIRAANFVDRLREYLNLSAIWATSDFAMGYRREGTIAFLTEQGRQKDFTVRTVQLVTSDNNGDRISSATIRKSLVEGQLDRANDFLGRMYQVSGEVVHGEKRGRKIGFPTANVAVWDQQLLPRFGVYACYATLGDEQFKAVTNIGQRPTFAGEAVTVEAHLLDFDRDIYGEILTLDFVANLRDEMKFSGIEALVAQIQNDVEQGRKILS
ncbi:MAG: bifunctional riboflavin kinase/FAD synthetase [Chloroflexi bacterium]|nr:bifunctional riboflavin kinase/FAD synthetase [Chloroflexota bacterium]